MNTELQAKFLRYLNQKCRRDEGYTLIELLIVIIVVGILAAIAYPSYVNQASKAKQSEAKQYVGSMNRAQQAYHLEKNIFTSNVHDLGIGIQTVTAHYQYGMSQPTGAITSTRDGVITYGSSTFTAIKSYLGGVQVMVTSLGGSTTVNLWTVLCEEAAPSSNAANSAGVIFTATTGTGASCNQSVYLPL